MHYYIDGYNWLFQTVKPSTAFEGKRRDFIEAISMLTKDLSADVTIVFDSSDPTRDLYTRSHFQDIEIIYTPKGQTADAYIEDAVALKAVLGPVAVVTLDRNLQDKCRALGATILTMKAFYSLCAKKKDKKIKKSAAPAAAESPQQIARLMKIFEERLSQRPKEEPSP